MTTNTGVISPLVPDVVAFLETLRSPLSTLAVHSDVQTTSRSPQVPLKRPVTVFLTYHPADNECRENIEMELRGLKREGYSINIIIYDITRAIEFFTDIDKPFEIKTYNIYIFLLSRQFLDRDEWYRDTTISHLIDNHKKSVWISPILYRECSWERTLFGLKPLLMLPNHQQPIAGSGWPDKDKAYKEVREGIRRGIEFMGGSPA